MEAVNLFNSIEEIDSNFILIVGRKTHVEDFIGGKATFKIEFSGKRGENIFDPRTYCHATFKFPKGWTRKEMLESGLNQLGFKTSRDDVLNWVIIEGVK